MTRSTLDNDRRQEMARTIIAAAIACMLAGPATAQDWPTRPLTMVVPFAAGASSDILGRILAPRLSDYLGKPVIIENVGGAGGMNGAARVAKAAPDGYQFVVGSTGTLAINQTLYKNPPYNAATDFAPVAFIADQPIVLLARNDLPVGNLAEFISYVRANQAKLQFASSGAGTTPHLACLMLHAAIGVNVTHIPYRGAALAIQDMIAGQTDYQCTVLSPALPQIEGKLVKPLALLARNRSPSLPALASAHEQGLADFDVSTWHAFFMPKGTPAPIVHKLFDATNAALNIPIVQERLKELGADLATPERRTPEYLQKFVEREIEKWAVPIKAAGVVAE
jgi:tripartite-type tricarboxylate transporter receptor subunit TctC